MRKRTEEWEFYTRQSLELTFAVRLWDDGGPFPLKLSAADHLTIEPSNQPESRRQPVSSQRAGGRLSPAGPAEHSGPSRTLVHELCWVREHYRRHWHATLSPSLPPAPPPPASCLVWGTITSDHCSTDHHDQTCLQCSSAAAIHFWFSRFFHDYHPPHGHESLLGWGGGRGKSFKAGGVLVSQLSPSLTVRTRHPPPWGILPPVWKSGKRSDSQGDTFLSYVEGFPKETITSTSCHRLLELMS